MPIEIGTTSPEQRLFDAIRAEAAALSFGERMKLFASMRDGGRFGDLPENLQAAFRRCAGRLGLTR